MTFQPQIHPAAPRRRSMARASAMAPRRPSPAEGMLRILRRALLALVAGSAVVALPACDRLNNLTTRAARPDTPLPYRTRFTRGEDRRDLAITVESRGAGLDEVREAVRFEATRYCLTNYGSSDADWTIDPATGDWFYTADGTVLAFQARCIGRT